MTIDKILRWLAVPTLIVAAACSGGDSSAASDGEQPSTEEPATDTADDEAEPSAEPLFTGLDGSVTLLTATSGGGARPLLEWEPVADADHYSAYVYAPDGDVYWVWTGQGTSVPVGGAPRIVDGAPGPSVSEGMTWAVLAHDASGLPLAVSEQRSIEP